ncbi:MAG TPA: glycoside hydrolase family 9 protein [Solirubrobacteraceae bacterium]|nr:glycoside hydrolase family 9 protein [Solirubrobacteraceae bacterium]
MPSALAVTVALVACGAASSHATQNREAHARLTREGRQAAAVLVRVNQVGFPADAPKGATVLARRAIRLRRFRVLSASGATVLTGTLGGDRGAWNGVWRHTYRIAFSALRTPGRYTIALAGPGRAHSIPFTIGGDPYAQLAARELDFLGEQRDGPEVIPSPLNREPSHLADEHAVVYGTPVYRDDVLQGGLVPLGLPPVDVAGGWSDAGDYLKLVETASFVEDLLLYTLRAYPSALGAAEPRLLAEARYGLTWLQRMWNQQTGVLLYQVGIGEGNAHIEGDHDVDWRLPQHDETITARPGQGAYYVRYRPVFADGVNGAPISPNLAGRVAAAFGLCAQLFAASEPAYAHQCLLWGQTIFDRADTHPGTLVTATPHDYYPEQEWQDDLELGADELFRATATTAERAGLPHPEPLYWFEQADHWGQAYMENPLDGTDTFNLYDVAALAHLELMADRVFASPSALEGMESDQATVLEDLHDQLAAAEAVARRDPFGIGYIYANDDSVAHLLGLSLEARFYDEISGTSRYRGFGQRELDAVLGDNPWGLSFVVGAGARFPLCLAHQVANLSGSLDGRSPLLLGAVVPGPVSAHELRHLSASEGYRRCPPHGGDPYAQFNGRKAAYEDNVLAYPSNEPSDDLAALALLAFTAEAAGG